MNNDDAGRVELDEQTVAEAARAALTDLQIDAEVEEVTRAKGGGGEEEWCVRFGASYGRFCDSFRDQFGRANSPALRREKVKRHLLQIQDNLRRQMGTRRRRGTRPTGGDEMATRRQNRNPLDSARQVASEVMDTATNALGNIIGQASNVADTARDTAASAVGSVSPTAGEVMRTGGSTRGGGGGRTRGAGSSAG
ncbi:MAG TPA: hypothetical protein VER32_06180, partial [Pyrinomonadaceae bacterium]|nr:hypothetical protein [Pyrinomonadaceae bacterium]